MTSTAEDPTDDRADTTGPAPLPTWDVEAVLTDLDGVLAASIGAVEAVWVRWADEVGLDPAVVLDGLHGRRAIDTVRRLTPDRDVGVETARLERYELELAEETEPIPGAASLIAALPADRWAVVTSGTRALSIARLQAVGHPLPKVLVSADDVERGKPDPEGYRAAAAAVGAPADRCLVVEDAPAGIAAARAAGCTVVAVTTSHGPATLGDAHAVVADPGHLDVVVVPSGLRISVRPPHWSQS